MMIAFWFIVVLLLMAASALLLAGGRRAPEAQSRDALNQRFYQQRLQALEQDDSPEREAMVRELQQTFLSDIPVAAPQPPRPLSRWVLAPGVLLMVFISLGLYLHTGGLAQVTQWQQAKNAFPALYAQVTDPQAAPLSPAQLAQLGQGLRSALLHKADNVGYWMMLGRIGMVLNNATTARQAFHHALLLQPDNRQARLGYAEVLSFSGTPQAQREAQQLLQAMLKHNASDLVVLGLLAQNSVQQQHYDGAIAHWRQMLTLLPVEDPRAAAIQRNIAQAQSAAGIPHN